MKNLTPESGDLPPMDPQEFIDAYQLASAVSVGEIPDQIRNPSDYRIPVGDGRVVKMTDHPLNRFGLCLARTFRGRDQLFQNFMMRFWAMAEAQKDPAIAEFVRKTSGEETQVHPAIFHAAALHDLNSDYRFDRASFVEKVRMIAKRLESEESSAAG